MKLTVLVIGSLPPPLGGCSVTLQHLVEALERRSDVDLRVLDTAGIRGNGWRGLVRFMSALVRLARLAREVDVVSLHVATSALPYWGLIVHGLARLARRPLIVRKFADTDYRSLGRVRGLLSHQVARRAAIYLVETRGHLATSRRRGIARSYWFPTSRPVNPAGAAGTATGSRPTCRRFVYVGHVCKLKGMVELVTAMQRLPATVSLDVYGPLFDDLPSDLFTARPGVAYHGPLQPGDVVRTMSQYDAFVIPTLASTEGYPGSVLEAFSAGLPVIASRVGGIPEIVDEAAGLLVEAGNVEDLAQAMGRLCSDPDLYSSLQLGARSRAGLFSSQYWSGKFVDYCREAMDRRVRG